MANEGVLPIGAIATDMAVLGEASMLLPIWKSKSLVLPVPVPGAQAMAVSVGLAGASGLSALRAGVSLRTKASGVVLGLALASATIAGVVLLSSAIDRVPVIGGRPRSLVMLTCKANTLLLTVLNSVCRLSVIELPAGLLVGLAVSGAVFD